MDERVDYCGPYRCFDCKKEFYGPQGSMICPECKARKEGREVKNSLQDYFDNLDRMFDSRKRDLVGLYWHGNPA